MAASEAQILVVFDYDWSLVNENSDTYVVAQLAPELQAQIFQERPAGEGWVCSPHCRIPNSAVSHLFTDGYHGQSDEVSEAGELLLKGDPGGRGAGAEV
eukprot:scaffold2809_cov184-Pinguiococcus_pyrenoidosus.AAC.3